MSGKPRVTKWEHLGLTGNSFYVSIGSDIKMSFAKVTNIVNTTEFDTISEGGLNGYVHTFTKQKQQQETIIFERGVIRTASKSLAAAGLKPGGRITSPVTIMLLENPGGKNAKVLRSYGFDQGAVIRWELSGLDAMGGEVLIERFEIAHSGLTEIT